MFISPDAADSQREQADEAEQDLDSGGDHAQVEQVGEHVEQKDRPLVLGIEVVMESHRLPQRLDHLGVVALVFHDDRVQVVGVFEIAHGAERHVDVLVQVVVAVVDDVFQNAHDLVGDAVHADALADRILAGEKLLLGVGSDKSDAGVGEVLRFAEGTAFRKFHAPHAGIDSRTRRSPRSWRCACPRPRCIA